MPDTRTVRVPDDHALDARRDDHERDGYRVVEETPASVTLARRDHGSLAWHLFVFIATFWWTAGIGNLFYALYRRYESLDRVKVRVVAERDTTPDERIVVGNGWDESDKEAVKSALDDAKRDATIDRNA